MVEVNASASGIDIVTATLIQTEKGVEEIHDKLFHSVHRMPGQTSDADLVRQLSNGRLSLYGRFLLSGEDVSISIWGTGIQCWINCEIAPDLLP